MYIKKTRRFLQVFQFAPIFRNVYNFSSFRTNQFNNLSLAISLLQTDYLEDILDEKSSKEKKLNINRYMYTLLRIWFKKYHTSRKTNSTIANSKYLFTKLTWYLATILDNKSNEAITLIITNVAKKGAYFCSNCLLKTTSRLISPGMKSIHYFLCLPFPLKWLNQWTKQPSAPFRLVLHIQP